MLPHAARIAVIAPSGAFDPARLERGLARLRAWGYRPEVLPGVGHPHRYLANTDAARLDDLRAALSGSYDAVWMARGGYGMARLLRDLDLDACADVPFLGFSDGTALLDTLAARHRQAWHAPVLTSVGDICDEASLTHLQRCLAGEGMPPMAGSAMVSGVATGVVRGGNLCVLASLCGTPWQLRAQGAIVALEEVGEAPYKVDRLLRQLLDSGALDGARGVALGDFLGAEPPAGAAWSLQDVLRDALAPLDVPVVTGLPFGHGARNLAFPMGVQATMVASPDGRGALRFSEDPA